MALSSVTVLCLLLMTFAVAADGGFKQQICNNLETANHDNGCPTLQCQFGQFIPIYEACGKEIDGHCHRVNEIFMNHSVAYRCRKVQDGNETVFRNEEARLRSNSCYEGGFHYVHFETTRLKRNRCEQYQCQNGAFVRIQKRCSMSFDGNCRFVGEIFVKLGTTFTCTSSEQDGVTKYKMKQLNQDPGQSCDYDNKTYAHLRIFTLHGICGFLQCQNGEVKVLTQTCNTKEYPGGCWSIGQRVIFGGITHECIPYPDNRRPRFEVVNETYLDCRLPNKSYHHLEIFQDGCHTVQCQDGKTVLIQAGCLWAVNSECYALNIVWKHGDITFKCISSNDGLYQVIETGSQMPHE